MTGVSSGKITLHAEGTKSIPALSGTPDILKMLELTPGVQTSGEGKSNIYVRGGDPGQTLLLYAGIPIYTPGHVLNIFPFFNSDHLSAVELIKGGVHSAYGNFLSGVILSKPKENVPLKTSLKGNVGFLASQATVELRINEKIGAYVSARKTYLDLLLNPLLNVAFGQGVKNKIEDMSYDFYDINTTVIGQLSENNKLSFNLFAGKDQLKLAEQFIGMDGSIDWGNVALSGKLEMKLKKDLKFEQQITYSRFQNELNVSLSEMKAETFSKIVSLGYDNKLNYVIKNLPFESGVQYKHYQLFPQEFDMRKSGLIFQDVSFGQNDAHSLALFTTTTLNFFSRLILEPGIRYNFFHSELSTLETNKNFHHLDFRLFARYQLSELQFLRATLSRNSQYVSKLFPSSAGLPTDFWVAASSEMKPQYGSEISFGYYHAFSDGMYELSSDIYFRNTTNSVEYNQNFIENDNAPFTERVLLGTGRAYGIELMLKKNFGHFSGWLSYSLGRSERKLSEINNGETFPARHDRTHDFSFTGNYHFNEKWDLSFTQILATGNAYTAPTSWYFINNTPVKEYGKYNNARLPYYHRTDIGLNYWFKKDNGINLSVYNLFAIKNPLYVNLVVNQVEDAKDRVNITMKKRSLFTIMPSIGWRFKF